MSTVVPKHRRRYLSCSAAVAVAGGAELARSRPTRTTLQNQTREDVNGSCWADMLPPDRRSKGETSWRWLERTCTCRKPAERPFTSIFASTTLVQRRL